MIVDNGHALVDVGRAMAADVGVIATNTSLTLVHTDIAAVVSINDVAIAHIAVDGGRTLAGSDGTGVAAAHGHGTVADGGGITITELQITEAQVQQRTAVEAVNVPTGAHHLVATRDRVVARKVGVVVAQEVIVPGAQQRRRQDARSIGLCGVVILQVARQIVDRVTRVHPLRLVAVVGSDRLGDDRHHRADLCGTDCRQSSVGQRRLWVGNVTCGLNGVAEQVEDEVDDGHWGLLQ
ncbi:Uncharacterised protein [Mycobacteroides abscessus subsp. abscessus]|nr:Uncharacterised protein [Mycobacteroides abscessus subsp. abscessus]SKR88240.1 Uncharacterised protein [Mycobacteroides abscessus subsp. abscessus]SKU76048.1 Uncharacterised protein [Mycobacteroides abscessus subsp. abscessus]SLA09779.1 Uncharacterised protein [Mycobacteroides abscessus subsp. abscessus]